ncbi:MAG: hypothetical protein AAGD25_03715 [Cyanobacteria bacterium P01_F01_bin.150]
MTKTIVTRIAAAILAVSLGFVFPITFLAVKAIAQPLTAPASVNSVPSQAAQKLQDANVLKNEGAGYDDLGSAYEQAFEAAVHSQDIDRLNIALAEIVALHYRHCADDDAQSWVNRGIATLPSVAKTDEEIQTYRNVFNIGRQLHQLLGQDNQIIALEEKWIEFAERQQQWALVSQSWRQIGDMYLQNDAHDMALISFQKSTDVAIAHTQFEEAILGIQQLGRTYGIIGNDKAAIETYNHGLSLLEENAISSPPSSNADSYDPVAAYDLIYSDLMKTYGRLGQMLEAQETTERLLRFLEQRATVKQVEVTPVQPISAISNTISEPRETTPSLHLYLDKIEQSSVAQPFYEPNVSSTVLLSRLSPPSLSSPPGFFSLRMFQNPWTRDHNSDMCTNSSFAK